MRAVTIKGPKLIAGGRILGPVDITIEDDIIADIRSASDATSDGEAIEAEGCYASPGYIDVHTHGALGVDVMDSSRESLEKISRHHLAHGTTSYLATTMTARLHEIQRAIDAVRTYRGGGARLMGVHLEGPFFTLRNAGAQNPECLHAIDDEGLAFIESNKDAIRRVSFAPELDRASDLVELCLAESISLSAGHDAAIDDEILPLADRGLECVTHIYCCSSTIGRRSDSRKHLGLTEIGLSDDRFFVEVIADRRHTPDRLFDLILKAKGYARICLVSDSIKYAGMPDGLYPLREKAAPRYVEKRGDEVSLVPDGPYAGSVASLDQEIMNIVSHNRVPLEQAVYMATEAPARLLHLKDRGELKPGLLADINILNEDGSIIRTVLGGRLV